MCIRRANRLFEKPVTALQKINETLEYAERNYKQRIEELEGERKKLLELSNDYQSQYKLLKSNYDNNSVVEDENKLYFYTGIPTLAIFDLVFDFVENSINQSDISKLAKKETFSMILMRLRLGLLEEDLAYRFGISQPGQEGKNFEKHSQLASVNLSQNAQ